MQTIIEEYFKSDTSLCSPVFGEDGVLYVLTQTGEAARIIEEMGFPKLEVFANSGGSPSSIALGQDGTIYFSDFAHQAILALSPHTQELTEVCQDFDGNPFQGTSSLCLDPQGAIIFADSGPFGTSTLTQPNGSVFVLTPATGVLRPLALNSLAHPCGLCVRGSSDIFVCELLKNRILRASQNNGVFHLSLFLQLNGRLGPAAACIHPLTKHLFVCQKDFADEEHSGRILEVDSNSAAVVREWVLDAPDLTGIAISPDAEYVYYTEGSTNTLYRFKLS
eukprot:GCRY01002868.1.p1 GENE.GCRY01002868.1~~GCRY01002868.1.p1  ORF type:complete len:278 (+),score=63.09 GCRY01002868.1:193-1026(+)